MSDRVNICCGHATCQRVVAAATTALRDRLERAERLIAEQAAGCTSPGSHTKCRGHALTRALGMTTIHTDPDGLTYGITERGAVEPGTRHYPPATVGRPEVCGRSYLDRNGDPDTCSFPPNHDGGCW